MRKALLLVWVAFAGPALAQQKISVIAFDGPGAATARNQIVAAICDSAECVPQAKVSAGGKPDWKKAKKLGVKFFVDGKVTKKGAKGTLELLVLNKPGKPKFRKVWPMTAGELSAKSLTQATAALSKAMGLGGGAVETKPEPVEKEEKEEGAEPKKEEKEEKKAPPPKKEKEEEEEPPKKHKKDVEEKKEEPKEEKKEEGAEEDGEKNEAKHIVLAVDLGLEGSGKYFSYTQTEKPNLRSYNAPFTVAPSFKLEFFPIALFSQGLAAGLGIEAQAAFVVGLKSRLPSTTGVTLSYPTSLFRVDFGAKFRIRPFAGSDAAIVPVVGLRVHSFKVGPADDGSGSVIDGLPGVSYTALRLGVGGEIPIGERLGFGAYFTAMPVFSSGEIISADWFPKGGSFGFDITAYMTFKIAGPLHIKIAGYFTRYGFTFETQPTDTYIAAGAVDIHAGGFVGLRLAF